jgi:hypothetical protein
MGPSNATLTFAVQRTQTDTDPITRQPIYSESMVNYRVFVRQDKRPATQVFPGADETLQLLKGCFVSPSQPDLLAIRDASCILEMDGRPKATCQFKPLGDQWGSTQKVYGRRIEGHRFNLLAKV